MIIHLNSFRYFWEVMENNEYSFIFDDLTIVDLGCEAGSFSLWIKDKAKIIYAIDCDVEQLDLFRKTIKDNEILNIRLYEDKVTNFNEFLSARQIPFVDILKIDIEGDEVQVFNNDFPADKVRAIIGEYHSGFDKSVLERLGYSYKEYPNNHFLARKT